MSRFLPVAALLAACTAAPHEQVEVVQESFAPAARVEIHLASGNVAVRSAPVTRVEQRLRWRGEQRPEAYARRTGGTLIVEASCPVEDCAVDVIAEVPSSAAVEVFTGSGDVAVDGIDAAVFVDTGAGAVDLHGLGGAVDVTSRSGPLFGGALAGPTVEAHTDAGRIDLELTGPVRQVIADTGEGDVELVVPAGAYALDLWSLAGRVQVVDVRDDASAASEVVAGTGEGDLHLAGR